MNNETLYSGLSEASTDTDKRYPMPVSGNASPSAHFSPIARDIISHLPHEIWGETGEYTMIESDKYISNLNQPGPFSAVLRAVMGILRWLIGFFTLTEEDRLTAGIYVGGEERDE